MGFLNGTRPCPPVDDPKYKAWIRQDQLLLLAIPTVVTRPVEPLMSRCEHAENAEEAWNKLKTTYANKFNSRMVGLIDSLTKVS